MCNHSLRIDSERASWSSSFITLRFSILNLTLVPSPTIQIFIVLSNRVVGRKSKKRTKKSLIYLRSFYPKLKQTKI